MKSKHEDPNGIEVSRKFGSIFKKHGGLDQGSVVADFDKVFSGLRLAGQP